MGRFESSTFSFVHDSVLSQVQPQLAVRVHRMRITSLSSFESADFFSDFSSLILRANDGHLSSEGYDQHLFK